MTDTTYGLGDRGEALYERYACADVAVNVLAMEAARAADRLDELDNIIQGKGVLNLMQFRLRELPDLDAEDPTCTVEVQFQNVLSEARQQQGNLAALIAKLSAMDSTKRAADPPPGETKPSWEDRVGNVTPLQSARAAAAGRP